MEQVVGLIKEFGWPGGLLIIIGFAAWRAMRFLAVKLFDDKTGYVPQIVNAHVSFVGTVEQGVDAQKEVSAQQLELSKRQLELAESHKLELAEIRKLVDRQMGMS